MNIFLRNKDKEKALNTLSAQGFFLISTWKNLLVILPYAIDTDDNGDEHESTSDDHNRKHGHGGLLYRYRFQKKETHSRKIRTKVCREHPFVVNPVYHHSWKRHKRKKMFFLTTKTY